MWNFPNFPSYSSLISSPSKYTLLSIVVHCRLQEDSRAKHESPDVKAFEDTSDFSTCAMCQDYEDMYVRSVSDMSISDI